MMMKSEIFFVMGLMVFVYAVIIGITLAIRGA